MDSSASAASGFDPSKSGELSMEEKRELVYEVSKWPDSAAEMLQAWTRQEILQLLCAELGKERKYTGWTKSKIIENLLKIVNEKKSHEDFSEEQPSPPKRQRKSDQSNRQIVAADSAEYVAPNADSDNLVYCKNSACKAKLSRRGAFCKRCSCCICRNYDDNKDPSLWLICNSDPPFYGVPCGMSCHLECALRHENSGISQDRQDKGLDGSFCCVSCRKVNDLLSSWRKQLVVARDTRRVDILCYRLSLGQKILMGTKHYQNLYRIIDEAVKMLEEDFGPLTGLPVKKARGIVNRLSSGPEIQRLCASAVESLDLMLSNRVTDMPSDDTVVSKLVRFEDVRASSISVILESDYSNMGKVVGYSLWHRKANKIDYPAEPTCHLLKPDTKFLICGLSPATHYFLKVVIIVDTDREMGFSEFQFQTGNSRDEETSHSPATNCSTLSNPSSVEDETKEDENRADNYLPPLSGDKTAAANLTVSNGDTLLNPDNKESSNEETSIDDGTKEPSPTGLECVPYVSPITPCNDDKGRSNNRQKFGGKNIEDATKDGSSSKKRSGERMRDEGCGVSNDGIGDKDFEYYVKVVRWLECEGHIETSFRRKFLTWYGLSASPQEVRVVKVFIDTFIEDPESLAGQLIDTFSDVVSNKRCSGVPAGFCMKLWH